MVQCQATMDDRTASPTSIYSFVSKVRLFLLTIGGEFSIKDLLDPFVCSKALYSKWTIPRMLQQTHKSAFLGCKSGLAVLRGDSFEEGYQKGFCIVSLKQ